MLRRDDAAPIPSGDLPGPVTADLQFDAVVVGASIAGSAAAAFLARHGLSVALLERAADPAHYKKTCNHVIQPSANGTLSRLGVLEQLRQQGAARHQVEAWSPYGWLPWDTSLEAGCNLRRERLDPLLRGHAANTPGVTLLLGHTVDGLLTDSKGCGGVVARVGGNQYRRLRAKLVVGADGRNSRVAKLARVPAQTSENGRAYYFAYYKGVELPAGEASMVWWEGRNVAMCFHTDSDLIVLGCMPGKETLPAFREDVEASMLGYLRRLPHGPNLANATRVSEVRGMLDMPNHVRPAAANGVSFVGDAALTSDPMVGVGCTWALQSAEWLAEIVGPVLRSGGDLDAALDRYRQEHAARLLPHHRMIARTSISRPFNLAERLLLNAAARDGVMTREVQRLANRLAQPKDVMTPWLFLRMLWVNIARPAHLVTQPRRHSGLDKGPKLREPC